jgi:integrase
VASVYLKRGTWYLSFRDANGRWRVKASIAKTKTEARRLAEEMERTFDRQARGLEPIELADGGGTVDELMEWWLEKFLRKAGSDTGEGGRPQPSER